MLRSIIFDFDGVIADTEPLHFAAFEHVFSKLGIPLTREEYFTKYLGLNDAAFLRAIHADRGRECDDERLRTIQCAKDEMYQTSIFQSLGLRPGVSAFVRSVAERWPIGICSGARRVEIDAILSQNGLAAAFNEIVSADDISTSKPEPAGYRHTVELLAAHAPGLLPRECLAIEDSVNGIRAARSAGIRTLAMIGVSDQPTAMICIQCVQEADWTAESFSDLDATIVAEWFRERA